MHMCNSGFSSIVFVLNYWVCGPRFSHLRNSGAVRREQSLPRMIHTFSKEVVFIFLYGLSESVKEPSKLSIPREDKPTQDDLLGDSVLENPLFEQKCIPKTRQTCWWEDKALCATLFGISWCSSLHLWKKKEITIAI